jgi:nicotinamide-nucleotide amidase
MNAEIITIGDELLIGQVVDTNSAWIAQQLNLIGLKVYEKVSVPDQKDRIALALTESLRRSEVTLVTGGLGPTKDDITKNVLCQLFNTHLVVNEDVLFDVQQLILSRNGKMNELNQKQAEVPANCKVIRNPVGTAPILWFEQDGHILVAMPGVPFEMKHAMELSILPMLKKQFKLPFIVHKNIMVTGIGEASLAEKIGQWEDNLPKGFKLAYLPAPGIVRLRISVAGDDLGLIKKEIEKSIQDLLAIIPDEIYGFDDESLEEVTGKMLKNKGLTLSTAESCTGGNIAHKITRISGCSDYFIGSVVAYSNDVKINALHVANEDIEKFGAVSKQVVEQMAQGARKFFNTDFAIATSGIAGPTGGTDEKPVGTVWISVASAEGSISEKFNFGDNRERNITRASISALNLLRIQLQKYQTKK